MNCAPPAGWTFDSTVEAVDAAEEATHRYAEAVGFGEAERYFLGLALREIFTNAIKHGNEFDPGKKVKLRLSNPEGAIVIEVFDEGQGFDISAVPKADAPENLGRPSGRGIPMALQIMDELHVEPARPRGTCVWMSKRLASAAVQVR